MVGVRTPLNEMHFNPTSRINSALCTAWFLSPDEDTKR